MERILLVEDDAQITASLSAFLQSEGFSVETATGETRARQLVEQNSSHTACQRRRTPCRWGSG